MKPPGAVIFDMDGVLLDSERLIRSQILRISAELGYQIADDVYLACVGRNARDVQQLFEEHVDPAYPYAEVFRRVDAALAHLLGDAGWPLRPSVLPALEMLVSHGVRRCVATSTARTRAQQRLQSARLLHFFEHVSGGDEVSRGKPAPDLFLLAAERLGVPPAACVVIEDSEYGAQGALEAGMRCVMVPDLKTPTDSIRKRVHGVFDDILLAVQSVIV